MPLKQFLTLIFFFVYQISFSSPFRENYVPHNRMSDTNTKPYESFNNLPDAETFKFVNEKLISFNERQETRKLLAIILTNIRREKAGTILSQIPLNYTINILNFLNDQWSLDLLFYVNSNRFTEISNYIASLVRYNCNKYNPTTDFSIASLSKFLNEKSRLDKLYFKEAVRLQDSNNNFDAALMYLKSALAESLNPKDFRSTRTFKYFEASHCLKMAGLVNESNIYYQESLKDCRNDEKEVVQWFYQYPLQVKTMENLIICYGKYKEQYPKSQYVKDVSIALEASKTQLLLQKTVDTLARVSVIQEYFKSSLDPFYTSLIENQLSKLFLTFGQDSIYTSVNRAFVGHLLLMDIQGRKPDDRKDYISKNVNRIYKFTYFQMLQLYKPFLTEKEVDQIVELQNEKEKIYQLIYHNSENLKKCSEDISTTIILKTQSWEESVKEQLDNIYSTLPDSLTQNNSKLIKQCNSILQNLAKLTLLKSKHGCLLIKGLPEKYKYIPNDIAYFNPDSIIYVEKSNSEFIPVLDYLRFIRGELIDLTISLQNYQISMHSDSMSLNCSALGYLNKLSIQYNSINVLKDITNEMAYTLDMIYPLRDILEKINVKKFTTNN